MYGNFKQTWEEYCQPRSTYTRKAAICYNRIDNEIVGFVNIYVPNHETARANFWKVMVEKMLDLPHQCVGEDFNMIEDSDDRWGGSRYIVHGWELGEWEKPMHEVQIARYMVFTNIRQGPTVIVVFTFGQKVHGD